MVDDIRELCEDAGGARQWLHDEFGSVEAYLWDGPAGQLQVQLDPVSGITFEARIGTEGEIVTGDVESVGHTKRLIEWVEIGGELPES